MSTIGEIRDAIANALSVIEGLRVSAVYPGQVNPPAAVVRRLRTEYGGGGFDGADLSTFGVSVYLPATDTVNSQVLLDEILSHAGDWSVRAALEADPSLGGIVRSLSVTTVQEEGLTDLSGVTYLSALIEISVVHE